MSEVIVITSGKGGTGKTSLTGGIGAALARRGSKVLCIDGDIGLRNLDITLGMTDAALMDFTDVMSGQCELDRAAAIVCDAEGPAVQVTDASADPLQGLRIFGRSTQAGDPTPDNPVDIVSLAAPVVTVSDGSGGTGTVTNSEIQARMALVKTYASIIKSKRAFLIFQAS